MHGTTVEFPCYDVFNVSWVAIINNQIRAIYETPKNASYVGDVRRHIAITGPIK